MLVVRYARFFEQALDFSLRPFEYVFQCWRRLRSCQLARGVQGIALVCKGGARVEKAEHRHAGEASFALGETQQRPALLPRLLGVLGVVLEGPERVPLRLIAEHGRDYLGYDDP